MRITFKAGCVGWRRIEMNLPTLGARIKSGGGRNCVNA